MSRKHIGFIGLGIMGGHMAAHLLDAGYDCTVYNRTVAKAEPLRKRGAGVATSPADVGQVADIVITMLAHPRAVEAVALGPDGFLSTLQPGATWVDCSTVNPAFSRQMAAAAGGREVGFLDAPVAGSKNQARAAELLFIVGGGEADLASCRPLLETMGQRVIHVGGHGMGISLKLLLNHLLGTTMLAFAEALTLGEALGLRREMLLDVIIGSAVAPPYLGGKRGKIESGEYDPEFPLRWMQKDLQMATEAAYAAGAPLPLSNTAKEIYQLAVRQGNGDEDFSAIVRYLGERSD